MIAYSDFIRGKSQIGGKTGFKPIWMPDFLFDFQKALMDWAIIKGRAAIFADCGLGKTPIQLVWAENVVRQTNKPVLIVTPLAVSSQTIREANKFSIQAKRSTDGTAKPNITVTNYEQLHKFNPNDYAGVVCDESSAIKDFEGSRQQVVTEFMRKTQFRLLCTATAAPNDYIELGTSAEAIGELGRMDMLSTFFKNDENSNHPIWWGARWRFKQYGEKDFWRWVCSWARAMRKPSDLGFSDEKFILPPLIMRETIVKNSRPFDGELFVMQATTLQDQRAERKATIEERCQTVAKLTKEHPISLIWCHYNAEGDLLEKLIPGSKQISGDNSDEEKEEAFNAFCNGGLDKLICKQRIAGFGLNMQRCAHIAEFPSHSFESHYQGVRRCWRFGQTQTVTVDIVTTEGELGVLKNLQRKSAAATKMFEMLVDLMNDALKIERKPDNIKPMEQPAWL